MADNRSVAGCCTRWFTKSDRSRTGWTVWEITLRDLPGGRECTGRTGPAAACYRGQGNGLHTAADRESLHKRLSVRASVAVALGQAASWLSRRTGRGDSATIGGRVALALNSEVLRQLSHGRRVAVVTGTDGKATTTQMITVALRACYGRVASNHTGANMPDGHLAALVADRGAEHVVLEVDEPHLHQVANQVAPAVVVLPNLFRDQLNGAEEIRQLVQRLAAAVAEHPQAVVVGNADDPSIVLAGAAAPRVVWVAAGASWRVDATACPRCERTLSVRGEHWWCECGLARPTPAWTVDDPGLTGEAAGVTTPEGARLPLRLRVPGAANRGNAAIALAAAATLGCPVETAVMAIEQLADTPSSDATQPPVSPELSSAVTQPLDRRRLTGGASHSIGADTAQRARLWLWVRRACYLATAAVILTPMTAFVIGYFAWDVPNPESLARNTAQTVMINYADNSELTRIVPRSGNRTMIRDVNRDVSKPMRDATLAAEDPTFYQNPGFDIVGILRAAWAQVTGDSGGGSTLTQQYIKLSTGNNQRTYARKFKEIVLAYKMNRQQSKDDILKAYLNTAYYGRGAYGIARAAEAYFHKQPAELDASEAAVLAGMVQQPTNNDPRTNPAQAYTRWSYVADQMARYRFITPAERTVMRPPETQDPDAPETNLTAVEYNIRRQVLAELDHEGVSEQDLQQHGYTIVTTLDPRAQKAAENAVTQVLQGQPSNLHPSLVAVDPATGAVRAYYGGGGPQAGGFDYAAAPQQPGSAFKPFVALAGLEQNRGLGEVYDGSSPQTIAGHTFANNPGVHCDDPPHCSVREAMTKSVNTVFVNMAVQFGPTKVAQAAYQAGISPAINGTPTLRDPNGRIDAGIALGMYPVRTIDMAAAYATFANNGTRNPARFVSKIVDRDGHTVRAFTPQPQAAFDPKDPRRNANLAANVTESLLEVVNGAHLGLADGRPVAGKTGTHQYGQGDSTENEKAWMVGYTPQISTAVSLSAGDPKHPVLPVRDAGGKAVYGSSLPGHIWQQFMDTYLTGQPVLPFTAAAPIGQFFPPPPPPEAAPPPQPPGQDLQPPKARRPHNRGGG
jgi:membrane peptidoglycan carboxypeptidase